MIRAAVCGGPDLAEAAALLGLREEEPHQVVLLDARSESAIARAVRLPADLPRVVVADGASAALLRSAGISHVVGGTAPELIGPALRRALPRTQRNITRQIVITAARGGVGRTLLATEIGRRLAERMPVWLIDATGTGAAAWWLRTDVRGWRELEPIVDELTVEHLRIVAGQPASQLRVIGGPSVAPSRALLARCLETLRAADELVIVDAPLLSDACWRGAAPAEDRRVRTLIVSYGDPASLAALASHELGEAWLIASQCRSLEGYAVFRALPRDEAALVAAASARASIGGRLGRAYAEFAELLMVDVT